MVVLKNLTLLRDDELRVEFHETTEAFVNMVKRALTDVPTAAVESVLFRKNTSCFVDEILTHRISMLPLRLLRDSPRPLTLRARGPCAVYAEQFEGEDVEVMHRDGLVVVLNDDEEIDLSANIAIASGKVHARHSAVIAPRFFHRHLGCETWENECMCPTTAWGTTRCELCNGRKREIHARDAPMVFVLQFETDGSLPPLEVLRRAFQQARAAALHVLRNVNQISPMGEWVVV